jgi:hypothetical protein
MAICSWENHLEMGYFFIAMIDFERVATWTDYLIERVATWTKTKSQPMTRISQTNSLQLLEKYDWLHFDVSSGTAILSDT